MKDEEPTTNWWSVLVCVVIALSLVGGGAITAAKLVGSRVLYALTGRPFDPKLTSRFAWSFGACVGLCIATIGGFIAWVVEHAKDAPEQPKQNNVYFTTSRAAQG